MLSTTTKNLAAFSFVALVTAACGAESQGGEGGGASGDRVSGDESSGDTQSTRFTCCINDTNYFCPSQAALDKCAGGFDMEACTSACAEGDFDCIDACFEQLSSAEPDPSECTEDPAAECKASGGSCSGTKLGSQCDVDGDCDSYNCYEGSCYETDVGNPCEVDGDCDSYNCYQSCCSGTEAGAGCEVDGDCESYSCFENVCQ
jgi:hypothetical protein